MYGYTRSHREHALARKGQVGEHNRTGDADELCGRVEALSRAGLEAVDAGKLSHMRVMGHDLAPGGF